MNGPRKNKCWCMPPCRRKKRSLVYLKNTKWRDVSGGHLPTSRSDSLQDKSDEKAEEKERALADTVKEKLRTRGRRGTPLVRANTGKANAAADKRIRVDVTVNLCEVRSL